jgi:hypothetical protein
VCSCTPDGICFFDDQQQQSELRVKPVWSEVVGRMDALNVWDGDVMVVVDIGFLEWSLLTVRKWGI